MSRHIASHHIASQHITSHRIASYRIVSHRIASLPQYAASCHAIPCHVSACYASSRLRCCGHAGRACAALLRTSYTFSTHGTVTWTCHDGFLCACTIAKAWGDGAATHHMPRDSKHATMQQATSCTMHHARTVVIVHTRIDVPSLHTASPPLASDIFNIEYIHGTFIDQDLCILSNNGLLDDHFGEETIRGSGDGRPFSVSLTDTLMHGRTRRFNTHTPGIHAQSYNAGYVVSDMYSVSLLSLPLLHPPAMTHVVALYPRSVPFLHATLPQSAVPDASSQSQYHHTSVRLVDPQM